MSDTIPSAPAHRPLPPREEDGFLTAWLRGSLARKYDVVLEEALPPALAELAGESTRPH